LAEDKEKVFKSNTASLYPV